MKDRNCVEFLQNILPRLSLRWSGYRKVHGQVCKRINRRIQELHLADIAGYQSYLEKNPSEWTLLKEFCRITISRFYRDRKVFEILGGQVLPCLAKTAIKNGKEQLRFWSVGCASGEEPFTLALIWAIRLRHNFPSLDIRILATDTNSEVLKRAEEACYPWSSLRELPDDLLKEGFKNQKGSYCLNPVFRDMVAFHKQDIREVLPQGQFHVLFCRNLVFTYFEESLQKEILAKLEKVLVPGGFLVIGAHEKLPSASGFSEVAKCIYRKSF